MKDSFSSFALRYVLALLVGIALLLSHRLVDGGLLSPLVPQVASPWELSKLPFWSLLAVSFLGQLSMTRLAQITCTTVVLTLCNWAILSLGGNGALCLVVWMAVMALVLAWNPLSQAKSGAWLMAVITLGVFYILLSYRPLLWGPFLDPSDVAAMATIPF